MTNVCPECSASLTAKVSTVNGEVRVEVTCGAHAIAVNFEPSTGFDEAAALAYVDAEIGRMRRRAA